MSLKFKHQAINLRGRNSNFVLRILIFALLFNGIAPVFAAEYRLADKVLLCTSQGYRWVSIAEEKTDPAPSNAHCVLCLISDDDPSSDLISTYDLAPPLPELALARTSLGMAPAYGDAPAFHTSNRAPPQPQNKISNTLTL